MKKITKIRIKKIDGHSYTASIPISVKLENIMYNNDYNLPDILGTIKTNTTIQTEIDRLETKVNSKIAELNSKAKQQLFDYIDNNYPAAEEVKF